MTDKNKAGPPVVIDNDDNTVDAATEAYLRADKILQIINASLPPGQQPLVPIPKEYVFRKRDRETVSIAQHSAFECIGGFPAYVAWAKANPSKFYTEHWAKLVHSETSVPFGGVNIQVVSAIPATPHDAITIDETGRVIDPAGDADDADLLE